jgi:hypothetical protein
VAASFDNRCPLAVRVPELLLTEYQDALPCCTDSTASLESANWLWVLGFALPVDAQLGIRMTLAIARATDLDFRVMFIVLNPFWGRFF